MFLSLTLMTRNYILIITYLGISMLYLCRITHGMLGWVLSFKLLNQLPKKCLFSWYFKVLHFSPILALSGVYFSFQQLHLPVIKVPAQNPTAQPVQGLWQKALKLRAPPAIRTIQGKACFGVSCPPIILWNIKYKSNSERTSHTILDNENLPVWSEFFLRGRLTTPSLPAAHILKVRSPDISSKYPLVSFA